jgi:DNA-binding CsgD family transcriptional regulator
LVAVRRRYLAIGSDADLTYVSGHLAMVYVWLGRYSVAADVADDLMRRGERLGNEYPILVARSQRALASAYLGLEQTVRGDARAAIAVAEHSGSPFLLAAWPLMALGFLEVSLGNFPEAVNVLRPLLVQFESASGTEIFSASYLPDAIEALVAIGRLDEATPLIEALEVHGARLDRPWMSAVGARGRSMSMAARGDLVGAEEMVRYALIQHDRVPMPFERARSQLLLGQLLRRQRHKHLAATTLREALVVFDELGTPLWSGRVAAELARTDAPRNNASELTPAELRVARLTASGMSNKDIASALFVSPKTVEHNLSRIYRKLDVRTRAELAGRADELDGQ